MKPALRRSGLGVAFRLLIRLITYWMVRLSTVPASRSLDYSGQERLWIEPFEYFPCKHIPIVAGGCSNENGPSLQRIVRTFRSSYRVEQEPPGKSGRVPIDPIGEVLYVEAGGRVRVSVTDGSGARTGPDAGSGQVPGTILLTLDAAARGVGLHRDTLSLRIEYDSYSTTVRLPVELIVRDAPAEPATIVVYPTSPELAPGDSRAGCTCIGWSPARQFLQRRWCC